MRRTVEADEPGGAAMARAASRWGAEVSCASIMIGRAASSGATLETVCATTPEAEIS